MRDQVREDQPTVLDDCSLRPFVLTDSDLHAMSYGSEMTYDCDDHDGGNQSGAWYRSQKHRLIALQ